MRKEREEERRLTLLEEERKKFEEELKVQRAQSDADSEWLRREEKAFGVSNGTVSENVIMFLFYVSILCFYFMFLFYVSILCFYFMFLFFTMGSFGDDVVS